MSAGDVLLIVGIPLGAGVLYGGIYLLGEWVKDRLRRHYGIEDDDDA